MRRRQESCTWQIWNNKAVDWLGEGTSWLDAGRSLEESDTHVYALRSSRVVLPRRPDGVLDGQCSFSVESEGFEIVGATIIVRGERIETVLRHDEGSNDLPRDCLEVRDVGDLVVMPGVVDAGARFGECPSLAPGSSSDCWEGFEVGTRAAAAGGVTTTIDLPSLDASPQEANDVRGRAKLAAGVSAVDVALAVRLESTIEAGDDETGEPSCRRAATLLSELDAYMSDGAVAAASFLTPPSWAARGIDVDSLARVLRTLASRRFAAQPREAKQRSMCTSRRRAGGHMARAKLQSRQQQGVIPIFVNTIKLAAEDLGPASPFRHLPFAARLQAKSPLMLLPFYQVESSPPVESKRSTRHLVASPLTSAASELVHSPTLAQPPLDQLKIPSACDSARSVDSRRTLNSASRGRANAGAACDPAILAGLDMARHVSAPPDRLPSQTEDDGADNSSQADDELPGEGMPEQQSQHNKKPKARAETIWEVIPFEETVIVSGDDKSAGTNAATVNTAAAASDNYFGCCHQTCPRTASTGTATACVGSASSGLGCYGGGSVTIAPQSSRESISDFEISLPEDSTVDSSTQPGARVVLGNFISDDNLEPSHGLSKRPDAPAMDESPCTRCKKLESKALSRDCVRLLRTDSPTSSTDYADNSDYQHPENPGYYHVMGGDNHPDCVRSPGAETPDNQLVLGGENRDYHRAVSSEEYHSPPRYAPRSRSSKDVKTDEAQSWVKSLLQAELATYSASRPPTPAQLPSHDRSSRQQATTTGRTDRRESVVDRDAGVVVTRGRQQAPARRRRRLSRWDDSTNKSPQRRAKWNDGEALHAQQQRRSVWENVPGSRCKRRSCNAASARAGLLDQILGFIPVAQGRAAQSDKDERHARAEPRGDASSESADRRKGAPSSAGESTKRRRAARPTAPVLPINIIARPPSPPRLGFERVSTWAEEAASPLGGGNAPSPTVLTQHGASSVASIDVYESQAEKERTSDGALTTTITTATPDPPIRPNLFVKSFSARSAYSASGSDRGSDDERRDAAAARHVGPPSSAPVATANFLSTLLQKIVMPSCDSDTRKSSECMDDEIPPTIQQRFVLVRRSSGFRRSGLTKRSAGVRSRSFDSRPQPDERECHGVSRNAHHKLVRVVVANNDDSAPETLVPSRDKWTSPTGIADADCNKAPSAGVAAMASSSKRGCSLNKEPATSQSTAPVRKKPIIASISKGTFVELKGSETLTAQAPHNSNPPAGSHVTRNLTARSATDDDLTLADDGDESSPTSRRHSSLSRVGSVGLDSGTDTASGAFQQRCSSTSTECLRTSDGSEESSGAFGVPLGTASDSLLVNVPAVIEINTPAPTTDGTSSSLPTLAQIDRERGFGRKRPPPIKIFKENDQHTRRAVRQDYSLYCDNHRSSAGSEGLRLLWNTAAQYVAASCGDSSLLGQDGMPDDYDDDENDLEDGRGDDEDSGLVEEDNFFFLSTSSLGTPKGQFLSTGACKFGVSPPFSPLGGKRRRRRSSRPVSPANENTGGVGDDDNDSLTSCIADTEEGDVGGLDDDDDDDDDDDPFSLEAAASRKVPASLHVSRVATLQTVRVLEDCQSHDVACAASGVSPLFGGLITGSVACYNLLFAEEDVPYGATIFKVAPPIRHEAHRRALWQSLRAKSISVVTSGHTPVQPEGKPSSPGDFSRAIAGTLIGANELFLSALWTAARHEGFELGDIAACLAAEPANLLQLAPRKGAIRDGADADFVLFDPDMEWAVDWTRLVAADKLRTAQLNQRRRWRNEKLSTHPDISKLKFVARPTQAPCLYDGKVLTGKVIATILRGRLVYLKGYFRDKPIGNVVAGRGRVVKRAAASATSHPDKAA